MYLLVIVSTVCVYFYELELGQFSQGYYMYTLPYCSTLNTYVLECSVQFMLNKPFFFSFFLIHQ